MKANHRDCGFQEHEWAYQQQGQYPPTGYNAPHSVRAGSQMPTPSETNYHEGNNIGAGYIAPQTTFPHSQGLPTQVVESQSLIPSRSPSGAIDSGSQQQQYVPIPGQTYYRNADASSAGYNAPPVTSSGSHSMPTQTIHSQPLTQLDETLGAGSQLQVYTPQQLYDMRLQQRHVEQQRQQQQDTLRQQHMQQQQPAEYQLHAQQQVHARQQSIQQQPRARYQPYARPQPHPLQDLRPRAAHSASPIPMISGAHRRPAPLRPQATLILNSPSTSGTAQHNDGAAAWQHRGQNASQVSAQSDSLSRTNFFVSTVTASVPPSRFTTPNASFVEDQNQSRQIVPPHGRSASYDPLVVQALREMGLEADTETPGDRFMRATLEAEEAARSDRRSALVHRALSTAAAAPPPQPSNGAPHTPYPCPPDSAIAREHVEWLGPEAYARLGAAAARTVLRDPSVLLMTLPRNGGASVAHPQPQRQPETRAPTPGPSTSRSPSGSGSSSSSERPIAPFPNRAQGKRKLAVAFDDDEAAKKRVMRGSVPYTLEGFPIFHRNPGPGRFSRYGPAGYVPNPGPEDPADEGKGKRKGKGKWKGKGKAKASSPSPEAENFADAAIQPPSPTGPAHGTQFEFFVTASGLASPSGAGPSGVQREDSGEAAGNDDGEFQKPSRRGGRAGRRGRSGR